MTHPLNLNEKKIVYDVLNLTASIFDGKGGIRFITLELVDFIEGDGDEELLALCDGNTIFVTQPFLDGILMEYGQFMTIAGDFN